MKNHYIKCLTAAVLLVVTGQQLFAQAAVHERLVGYRVNYYKTDSAAFFLSDSMRFTYSNGRGAVDIDNEMCDDRSEVTDAGNYAMKVLQFDAHNNAVQINYKNWNINGYVDDQRYLNTFNAANKLTTSIRQGFVGVLWVNDAKFESTYNNFGDTTGYLSYNPDTGTGWVLGIKYDYLYDSLRRHSADLNYYLINGAVTDTGSATYYSYDFLGYLGESLTQNMDTAFNLQNAFRTTYVTDTAAKITGYTNDNWVNGAWLFQGHVVNYYNALWQIRQQRLFGNDGMGGSVAIRSYTYTYNANNLNDTMYTNFYSNVTADFEPVQRSVFTYNDSSLVTSEEVQTVDSVTWSAIVKNEYQYNTHNHLTYRLYSNILQNVVTPNTEYIYYYQNYALVSGVQQPENVRLSVFPNPTHGNVNVAFTPGQFSRLTLTNLSGQTVLNQEINEAATRLSFDSSHLTAGIYLVHLSGATTSTTTKIIIE